MRYLLSLFVLIFVSTALAENPTYKLKMQFEGFKDRSITVSNGEEVPLSELLNQQLLELNTNHERFVFLSAITETEKNESSLSCLINQPHFILDGAIMGFEFVTQIGLKFGFWDRVDYNDWRTGTMNLNLKRTRLELQVLAKHPLAQTVEGMGLARSHETKMGISGQLNLWRLLNIGYDYYRQTPLSEVTRKGLKISMERLEDSLKDSQWSARVMSRNDDQLVIDAGKRSGLKVGDEVEVLDTEVYWRGQACESDYLGELYGHSARVKITAVGERVSRAILLTNAPWLSPADTVIAP